MKRRVKRLENEIGGTSALHYLIVVGADSELREQALARTLTEQGLTMDDIGRATFFGSKMGTSDAIYHPEIPFHDLVGSDELKRIIEAAGKNITLDPPNAGEAQ